MNKVVNCSTLKRYYEEKKTSSCEVIYSELRYIHNQMLVTLDKED